MRAKLYLFEKKAGLFPVFLLLFTGLTCCVEDDPVPVRLPGTIDLDFPRAQDDDETDDDMQDLPGTADGDAVIKIMPGDPVTDIDGNIYPTVQIGDQTWMAANLMTIRYNDGDSITLGKGGPAGYTDWFDCGDGKYQYSNGAYCWYDNDGEKYKKTYGAIYNWHAIKAGKLCPAGWHVPSDSEWNSLIDKLGGDKAAYSKLSATATGSCGFNVYPAGGLCGWGFIPNSGVYWTETSGGDNGASVPYAFLVSFWVDRIILASEPQSYGYSVRCLKDK